MIYIDTTHGLGVEIRFTLVAYRFDQVKIWSVMLIAVAGSDEGSYIKLNIRGRGRGTL